MAINNIKVEGKSGCPICIKRNNDGYFIEKKSKEASYSPRLKKQILKQINFYEKSKLTDTFQTPKIINSNENDSIYCVEMELINAESYSSFLVMQHKKNLDLFVEQIYEYLTQNIKNANFVNSKIYKILLTTKTNELDFIFSRINSIEKKILDDTLSFLKYKIPNSEIPIGTCHGDFTLSNMLFANSNKIYLIDFLDSFIESPLIDYIKLRQDTKYHWSPFIEGPHKEYNVRLKQSLNYIDTEISNRMNKSYGFIKKWEKYLTIMNFARILPYANSENDFKYLTHNIKKLLY